jgi:uncharacterized protein (TIGR02266 family)
MTKKKKSGPDRTAMASKATPREGLAPELFAKLTEEKMLAEFKRLGLMHGQSDTLTELVVFYRDWFRGRAAAAAEAEAKRDKERRTATRVNINVEIGLRTETNFFLGFSGDISEGGVFVSTVSLLPIGTTVTLMFSFPGGIEVEADGEVAWIREGTAFDSDLVAGVGIHFTRINKKALAAVKEFIDVREPIFYD